MEPDSFTDPAWLSAEPYADDVKLQARLALHQRYATATRDVHAWIFDRLPTRGGLRVLEVGCGPGTLWRVNSGRLPPAPDRAAPCAGPGGQPRRRHQRHRTHG